MTTKFIAAIAASSICLSASAANLITYNSGYPEANAEVRTKFFQAVGIHSPQYLVDFETGFGDQQNIAGMLLPGRLVIRGNNGNNQAIIEEGPASISLSNPVGKFAVSHTPSAFSGFVLDFTGNPVDYVAWQDIDTTSNNSLLSIFFEDGSTQNFHPDATLTTQDSAEFLGFYRNDHPRIAEIVFRLSGDTYGIDNIEYGRLPQPSADFNGDSLVDGGDLAVWQAGFGSGEAAVQRLDVGRDEVGGDADTDGDVDGSDFLVWQQQLDVGVISLGAAIPEPSALMLLLVGVAGLSRFMRR
jgi:hypothetical protein